VSIPAGIDEGISASKGFKDFFCLGGALLDVRREWCCTDQRGRCEKHKWDSSELHLEIDCF